MEAANDVVMLRLSSLQSPEAHTHVKDMHRELHCSELAAVWGELGLRVPACMVCM
jgi:hypothetical protein